MNGNAGAATSRTGAEELGNLGVAAHILNVLARFWPFVVSLSIFCGIISYIVEFSIYKLDVFTIMSLNDIAFKSTQNVIWFGSIALYVIATAYIVGLSAKWPIWAGAPFAILITALAIGLFVFGFDATHIWNRYIFFRADQFLNDQGWSVIHLDPSERRTAEAEVVWSQTHYVFGIRADVITWITLFSLAFLALAMIGFVAANRLASRLPLLVGALVLAVLSLNASLGVDRAMLLDPKINLLEGGSAGSYLTLPPGMDAACRGKGSLIWQGEKSLVLYCPHIRSNLIYSKDYGSIIVQPANPAGS